MMETLTSNLQSLIKEDIKNTQKEAARPQWTRTPAKPSTDHNTGNENLLPSTSMVAQEEESDINEGQWRQVTSRRERRPARRQQVVTGAGPRDDDIQAADKMAWLFVGRLKLHTTADAIKRYIAKKGITGNVTCEELAANRNTKAFKLGIPFNSLETTKEAEFWPTGIIVRRFRFSRSFRDNEGELYE